MRDKVRKNSTNLSIRSDLLQRARDRNINLSKTLEQSLERILQEHDRQAWIEENQEALESANRFVAERGLWNDGLRMF